MFKNSFEIYSLAILLIAVSTVSVVNDRIVDISVGTFPVAAWLLLRLHLRLYGQEIRPSITIMSTLAN